MRDAALPTTVKLRVIGRQQQLLRIDFETRAVARGARRQARRLRAPAADADVVVLSDYGKGGLAHIATMIERARAAGKPVLVDPEGRRLGALSRRDGDHAQSQPNSARSSGRWRDEADLARRAQAAARASSTLEALLVTRSEEGMSLFTDDGALHDSGAGARGVRRLRRRRHGDRDARRAARRRRRRCRRGARSPTRRRASSSASSAPPSSEPGELE